MRAVGVATPRTLHVLVLVLAAFQASGQIIAELKKVGNPGSGANSYMRAFTAGCDKDGVFVAGHYRTDAETTPAVVGSPDGVSLPGTGITDTNGFLAKLRPNGTGMWAIPFAASDGTHGSNAYVNLQRVRTLTTSNPSMAVIAGNFPSDTSGTGSFHQMGFGPRVFFMQLWWGDGVTHTNAKPHGYHWKYYLDGGTYVDFVIEPSYKRIYFTAGYYSTTPVTFGSTVLPAGGGVMFGTFLPYYNVGLTPPAWQMLYPKAATFARIPGGFWGLGTGLAELQSTSETRDGLGGKIVWLADTGAMLCIGNWKGTSGLKLIDRRTPDVSTGDYRSFYVAELWLNNTGDLNTRRLLIPSATTNDVYAHGVTAVGVTGFNWYICGLFYGTFTFGGKTIAGGSGGDGFVLRYNPGMARTDWAVSLTGAGFQNFINIRWSSYEAVEIQATYNEQPILAMVGSGGGFVPQTLPGTSFPFNDFASFVFSLSAYNLTGHPKLDSTLVSHPSANNVYSFSSSDSWCLFNTEGLSNAYVRYAFGTFQPSYNLSFSSLWAGTQPARQIRANTSTSLTSYSHLYMLAHTQGDLCWYGHLCVNGATCLNGLKTYTCVCPGFHWCLLRHRCPVARATMDCVDNVE